MMLAALAKEAGLPDGVLNIIHGTHDAVNFICDAPEIKAISFVGGNAAGEHIYARVRKAIFFFTRQNKTAFLNTKIARKSEF